MKIIAFLIAISIGFYELFKYCFGIYKHEAYYED